MRWDPEYRCFIKHRCGVCCDKIELEDEHFMSIDDPDDVRHEGCHLATICPICGGDTYDPWWCVCRPQRADQLTP